MRAEFHIQGVHRDSSAADIKAALEGTAGGRSADVTVNGKTAVVEFDDEVVQRATLVKKIQDLGYQATIGDQ